MSAFRTASLVLVLAACSTEPGAEADAELSFLPTEDRVASPIERDISLRRVSSRDLLFRVEGLAPFEAVTFVRGQNVVGDGPCTPSGAACLDFEGPATVFGQSTADGRGIAFLRKQMPPNLTNGAELAIQAFAIRGTNGEDSVTSDPIRVPASDGLARLQIVHASPDAPNVDIYANDGLLLADVPYTAASDFVSVPAGDYDISIRAAGADPNSAPVFAQTLTVAGDNAYTVVATGFLGSSDPADAFRVLALDTRWGDIDPEAARVRVVHTSPDAPAVGIDVFADGVIDVPRLRRFADTGGAGIPLPAETALPVAITTTAGDRVTSFSVPPLPRGGEVTVLAIGELGKYPGTTEGFSLLALFRDASGARILQDPVVYALHASPDAPAVDVRAGDAVLAGDLAFRELSAPIQVPPGAYTLDITGAGDPTIVASVDTPSLEAGERYLATATGFLNANASNGFQVLFSKDTFDREDDNARLQVIHASPDAPTVDVGTNFSVFGFFDFLEPFLEDVSFGQQTEGPGISLAPGSYDLGVGIANDPLSSTLFSFNDVELFEGNRTYAVATGSVAETDFALTLIETSQTPWGTFTLFPTIVH
jgi:hypothetical protein